MEKRSIALTFDDGPNTTTTVAMLNLLQQTGVPASFFLVGNNITAETVPVVQRAFAMGCEIHNHSVSHRALTELTPEQMLAEVQPVTQRITEITGTPPRFFRPPYIATNPTVFATVPLPMICGFGVEDYNDAISAEERFCRLKEGATDGMILLLHDSEGNDKTAQAVAKLIPALQAQGFEFVTLSRLFALKKVNPQPFDGQLYSVL
ncbi:MAG: polysaccharide deacetylase family protein [Oscillospiraceae bacterium]|nr:polysaccharide deacetylase family protein [Oscillospiraceae bacterium]